MRTFLKTIGMVTVLLAFVTAIIALLTEGVKFYRETAAPNSVSIQPTSPPQSGAQVTKDMEVEVDSTQGWQPTGVYLQ